MTTLYKNIYRSFTWWYHIYFIRAPIKRSPLLQSQGLTRAEHPCLSNPPLYALYNFLADPHILTHRAHTRRTRKHMGKLSKTRTRSVGTPNLAIFGRGRVPGGGDCTDCAYDPALEKCVTLLPDRALSPPSTVHVPNPQNLIFLLFKFHPHPFISK